MTIENEEFQYDEDYLMPSDQMDGLDGLEVSGGGKVVLLLARISLVGISLGFWNILLTANYSVQHALYAFAGIIVFLCYMFGIIRLFSKWLVVIMVWFFLSICISTYLSPFIIGNYPYKRIMFLLSCFVCGMAIANSQNSLRKFGNLMIFTGILSCVLAALQATTGRMFWFTSLERGWEGEVWAEESGRAIGLFRSPVELAHWLLIPIAITTARITYLPRRAATKVSWILLPILLGGMMLSVTRSGIIATVAIIFMVLGRRIWHPKAWIGVSISLIVIIIGASKWAPDFFFGIVERLSEFTSDEARRVLFDIALKHIGDRPWIGVGFLGFRGFTAGQAAHNGILEPLLELGIFGFIPVIAGLFGGLLCFWKCARLSRGSDTEWLWRGWAAGTTGLFMSEMLHGAGWHSLMLWTAIGIGSAGLVFLKKQIYYEQLLYSEEEQETL
ncbi:MAG: O-antigen ligase family protein [Planctomycetota bacterium]|jgi:O-antigen ligase